MLWKQLNIILLFCFICLTGDAQIFLRLDMYDDPESTKFYPGDKIEIKTKTYPDSWQKKRIESIIPESNTIIFDQDFMTPEEIIAIRLDNIVPRVLGRSLMQFGTAWTMYGTIAYVAGGDVTKEQLIIGGATIASGYTIKKLGSYNDVILGKGNTLRIIDIRF